MKLEVLNIEGKKTGRKVDLPANLFAVEPNDHVVYLAVKQYMAHQRQGTHKAKERNEVEGSSKKLHKQKGTGGARKGNLRNPLYRKGGRVFGPQPRDYDVRLNKKTKQIAKASAFTYKAKENNVMVIEDFNFDTPKTKSFISVLKNLGIADKKTLLVTNEAVKNVVLSGRNLPKSGITTVQTVNIYDIMNAQCLLLTENSLKTLAGTNNE